MNKVSLNGMAGPRDKMKIYHLLLSQPCFCTSVLSFGPAGFFCVTFSISDFFSTHPYHPNSSAISFTRIHSFGLLFIHSFLNIRIHLTVSLSISNICVHVVPQYHLFSVIWSAGPSPSLLVWAFQ